MQEKQTVLVIEIFQHPEHRLLPLKAPPPWVLEIPPPTSCAAKRLRGSETDAPTVVQQTVNEAACVVNTACKQHSKLSEKKSRQLRPPRRPSSFMPVSETITQSWMKYRNVDCNMPDVQWYVVSKPARRCCQGNTGSRAASVTAPSCSLSGDCRQRTDTTGKNQAATE